jgi:hypothetical protein
MPLAAFWQDLRYTVRGLRSKPGFTSAVVFTLALGIGANAAMYGVVDRILFRPPPTLRDPSTAHRLYHYSTVRGREQIATNVSYARYADLRTATRSFSDFAAYTVNDLGVGAGDDAREMKVAIVSASFFDFFDASPARGRYFDESEDAVSGGKPVVVISHALWSTRFGERPDALGSTIRIDTTTFTIVGIAPRGFAGLWPDRAPAAYIPISTYAATRRSLGVGTAWARRYRASWLSVMARRRPDATIDAADTELTAAARRSYEAEMATQPTGRDEPVSRVRPHVLPAVCHPERSEGPLYAEENNALLGVEGSFVATLLRMTLPRAPAHAPRRQSPARPSSPANRAMYARGRAWRVCRG